ncbi:MAG: hypothetical protein ACJAR9_000050 [Celeribacter sp.]|jgi:hypothetical protein
MNRIELIIATAIVLFIAFLMGWFTHWVIHRFVRVGDGDMSDLDTMAQQLHDAEEQRDQAVTYYQQRESEMNNQQTQTEAELRAAMEGLREARHEAEELRAYIERQSAD